MDRTVVKSKIVGYFKQRISMDTERQQKHQIQMGFLLDLFQPEVSSLPAWQQTDVFSIAREIVHEFINIGALYPGQRGQVHGSDFYPHITITEYGKELFMSDDWLPYDPDGYLKALYEKIPEIDEITCAYIGESVAALNRQHLLSATITLGVASENIMLILIESYATWLSEPRKNRFQKRIENKFISKQYNEFKAEFRTDVKSLPKDLQGDWEIYLDGFFNFIRINRNDAGHPTGKELRAKVIYANLQIFADYTRYIFDLKKYFYANFPNKR